MNNRPRGAMRQAAVPWSSISAIVAPASAFSSDYSAWLAITA